MARLTFKELRDQYDADRKKPSRRTWGWEELEDITDTLAIILRLILTISLILVILSAILFNILY